MTPLGRALAALGELPDDFAAVDEAAAKLAPDLAEHSVALRAGALASWRATYYLDRAGGRPPRRLGDTLGALGHALGVPVPAPLTGPLDGDGALDNDSVLQDVLGVDAGPPLRLKRYLVYRRPDRASVERLLAALGAPDDPALDAGRVYILGFDLDANGLAATKLYFKLARSKVGGFLRGRAELGPVLRGSREVVFGHRLGGGRRTMYFHASGPRVLRDDLTRRAVADPRARALRDHLARLDALHPMDPWIAGIPYADGALSADEVTLYLHPRRP